MPAIRFDDFEALTFDCYGTLVDWERGILAGLRPALDRHGIAAGDAELLEAYGRHEAELEGGPYLRYRDVVAGALRGICADHGVEATDAEAAAFGDSVGDWPPFPDSAGALARLSERFRLGRSPTATATSSRARARSSGRIRLDRDRRAGAELQARATDNFELAFETIEVPRDRILHVAQSLFHDHVPAKELGMTTVWIDRRGDAAGRAQPRRPRRRPT